MKLEEGMYVRTSKGNISKIKWISNACYSGIETKSGIFHLENDEIINMLYGEEIKASHNIIDLIEVGDYVNGKEIEQIIGNELYFETSDMARIISFKEKDIKSIVTKEQFASMQYEVK